MISVQTDDFNHGYEYQNLIKNDVTGAVVTFVGLVRDFEKSSTSFFLQHYPGMTEKVLKNIEDEANTRWELNTTRIIHRIGELSINDQIVFVGVGSPHRKEAFRACEFMIDLLKTQAPFWKKEGDSWVEAKNSDQKAANVWLQKD